MDRKTKQNYFINSKFIKFIRLTVEDWKWIMSNKNQKSAAGFLEQIIKEVKGVKRK